MRPYEGKSIDKKVNGIIFMDVGELKRYGIFRLYKTGFQEEKSLTFETGIRGYGILR